MVVRVKCWCMWFFFFKPKTAYEMRISDWSSDVCSSDLRDGLGGALQEFDDEWQVLGTPVGLAQQRGTRIDRPELLHPMAVVWEVPAGTASDLKHAASGKRNEPLEDSSQLDVLHRQLEQRRTQERMIGAHRHRNPWRSEERRV